MTRRRRVLTSAAAHRAEVQQAAAYRRAIRDLERRRHAHQQFPFAEDPGPGRVRLVADEPPTSVTVLLAADIDVDGAVGGWEEIPRDQRTPAIVPAGTPRATATLDCFIDTRVLQIDDAQTRVEKLYAMGRPDDTTGEPARIQLLGDVPAYNPLWVIDTVKPTRILRDSDDGHWTQVRLTIGLSEWEDATLAATLPPAATRNTKGKPRPRHYTTRAGDTLRRIALTELGSQGEWKTLLAENRSKLHGVDPDALLQPGTRLRLTTATS